MLTKYAALAAAAVATLAAALAAATPTTAQATTGVVGSSHREAPRIMLDPAADTDPYASNWIPLQNPAGGPYSGKLDPSAA
jgi:hypothetical protein